jgi:hypothetical protein
MSPDAITERKLFNPFPGLRPFEMHEAHLFFGRDGQSDEIIRRLARTRFVGIVGTSGSGKSSLVRAGLLPALHGGFMRNAGSAWRVALFRPGDNPIRNLAAALSHPECSEVKSRTMTSRQPFLKPHCGGAIWGSLKRPAFLEWAQTKPCSSSSINSKSCFVSRKPRRT